MFVCVCVRGEPEQMARHIQPSSPPPSSSLTICEQNPRSTKATVFKIGMYENTIASNIIKWIWRSPLQKRVKVITERERETDTAQATLLGFWFFLYSTTLFR